MRKLFWDTETDTFSPGRQAPALSCVAWRLEGEPDVGLIGYKDAREWFLRHYEDPEVLFIGHHIAYDLAVYCAQHPEDIPKVFALYKANRVTDTMLRMKLIDIAMGKYRGSVEIVQKKVDGETLNCEVWRKWGYSLDDCYFRMTKKRLDKDTWRLRYGTFRDVPIDKWVETAAQLFPHDYAFGVVDYPKKDVTTTEDVYHWQVKMVEKIERILQRARHLDNPKVLKDEFAQARAAWWIDLMHVWGIRTDEERVGLVAQYIQGEYDEVVSELIGAGLVREDGSRNIKAAQARMIHAMGGIQNCKLTDTAKVQLTESACRESGDPMLMSYADMTSLGVVLSKDLPRLMEGTKFPIHARFDSIVATGRTSCSGPNLQNVRRLPGIRECFVPRPGYVFLDADYDGLELRTLAQVCLKLLGKSKLADVLNAGMDPHLSVAAAILHREYSTLNKKEADVFQARQLGKAANFGFPGGLGLATFVQFAASQTPPVHITVEEASDLKRNWFKAFPEMRDYFDLIGGYPSLVEKDEERGKLVEIQHVFSGRIRGQVPYTVACNSYFQGLGSDATKAAGFLIAYECYVDRDSPLFGCRIVNYIHDQFLLECPEEKAHIAVHRLARVMEEGAAPFLPDVPPKVSEPLIAKCWSKDAYAVYDESGRMIAWEPKEGFQIKKRGH